MKLKRLLASILPGLFLIGFNIGTGSVTAMAKAGADHGMSLLWTILLSCIATYFLMVLYGKYTAVTGETALQAFRKHIHPAVGLFFIVALTINVSGGIMGVNGVITEVLYEWSLGWTEGGISAIVWTGMIVGLVYLLFLTGRTKIFERALAVMVAVMGLCFFINFFIMMPPLADIAKGLLPNIPESLSSQSQDSTFLVIASMVGTTVSSMVLLVRTTLIKEEGWGIQELGIQKRDAGVSATMMFLISASIMAAAAGTLFIAGHKLDNASDLVGLLAPFAGGHAVTIFVIGLAAAGVSSQFPNILLLPWLLADNFSLERDMTRWHFRLIVLVMSLFSFVVPVFGYRPVWVMLTSQAFAAFVLPATVACIFYLTSRKSIMGVHANGWKENALLSLIMGFALIIGAMAAVDFWEQLNKFL